MSPSLHQLSSLKINELTMVMMKSLVFSAVVVASSVADASTTVAVLEFGKKGCVHRTTTKNTDTTVSGVKSFWNALSGTGLQDPDMTVVPDLFKRPSGHVVLGITGSGVDLDSMPTVSKLVQSEGDKVAGQMTISGSHGRALLNKVGSAEELSVDSIIEGVKNSISADKLSALNVKVEDNASQVDSQIAAMLTALQEQAGDDSTFVVHLVVEEEEGAARRRLMARRLEDAQNNGKLRSFGRVDFELQ
jgi:hypothetical protein